MISTPEGYDPQPGSLKPDGDVGGSPFDHSSRCHFMARPNLGVMRSLISIATPFLLIGCASVPVANSRCGVPPDQWRELASPPKEQDHLLALALVNPDEGKLYWFQNEGGELLLCRAARIGRVEGTSNIRRFAT